MRLGEVLSASLTPPLAGNDAIRSLAFAPDGSRLLGRSIFGRWMSWKLEPASEDAATLADLAQALDPASATRRLDATQVQALRERLLAHAEKAPPPAAAPPPSSPLLLDAVPDAAADLRFRPLDLGAARNVQMGRPWIRMAAQGGDLASLPPDMHRLDGIDWRIDGAIQLSGGGPALSLHPYKPQSDWVPVPAVPARRVHVLMLLHIPMQPGASPRLAGTVEVRREDASLATLEIQSVRDVVTHWQPDLAAATARVAWRAACRIAVGEPGPAPV